MQNAECYRGSGNSTTFRFPHAAFRTHGTSTASRMRWTRSSLVTSSASAS